MGRPPGSKFAGKFSALLTRDQIYYLEDLASTRNISKAEAVRATLQDAIDLKSKQESGAVILTPPRSDLQALETLVHQGFVNSVEDSIKEAIRRYIEYARGELMAREADKRKVY